MTESIFARIFSYRQRKNNTPLENFITEIFAFCLQDDEAFRKDFLNLIPGVNYNNQECRILTQEEYEDYGRPDIEMNFGETSILFECKIEAAERTNQLNDYASILISKKLQKQKHIVFLTKYFEHKEINTQKVNLHLKRWLEVFKIINRNHRQVTQHLKKFLKECKMETVKNFTIQDLLALKAIPATISKMDELLEQFKYELEKKFGGFSRDSSRSYWLKNSRYLNYVDLTYQRTAYSLLIGFFWDWVEEDEIEIPHVGISIRIPTKKLQGSDIFSILDRDLLSKNWEYEEYDTDCYYSALKPVTDFISQKEDNIPAMKKFIDKNLQTIYALQKKYPKLFKKL